MKNMAVEINKILDDMGPDNLESPFLRSNVPYQQSDNNKLIQPLERTITFGNDYFAFYLVCLYSSRLIFASIHIDPFSI